MAMLKREELTYPAEDVHTILGPEATFDGKLTFEGTVRIDGTFRGEVRSEGELVIGQSARLEALIWVGSIVVIGEVNGDIHAKRSVEIQAPGKVRGNISTPQLSIAKGVIFEGACKMEDGAGSSAPASSHLSLIEKKNESGSDSKKRS